MDKDFFRVILPFPDWKISPNGTKNKWERAALTKQHREAAYWIAKEAVGFQNWVDGNRIFAVWLFRQPDKRHRDVGNMMSSMKAYQDGIADALSIDDFVIDLEIPFKDGVKKGGEVEVRLYEDLRQWLDDVIILAIERYGDGIITEL